MSISDEILKKYLTTLPKLFQPEFNPVMRALILALVEADAELNQQALNGKDQLFLRTATGQSLAELAQSLGVAKPATLGLTDEEFQELVPNLSLKPKQLRKSFYDTADVFWGPLFSRANISTNNLAPYSLNVGDELTFAIDNRAPQTVKVLSGDLATPGTATANELVTILSRLEYVTPEAIVDSITGDSYVNLRTNTPGPVGSIEVISASGIGSTKVDFTIGKVDILKLDQRVAVYNINPNELLVEIPAVVPALKRTLKGSHHFHADGTLEPPRGTAQGIWAGSFLFNPSGTGGNFTLTSQRAVLQQTITKGQVYTSISVDDTSLFNATSGELVFDFGNKQEVPVRFRGVPNSNTILLDPSYTFQNTHEVGTMVNVISEQKAYVPTRDGEDLAIYLTSPSGAREVVEDILETLASAGIKVTFLVLAPTYRYLLDNPYIDDDDAPSS